MLFHPNRFLFDNIINLFISVRYLVFSCSTYLGNQDRHVGHHVSLVSYGHYGPNNQMLAHIQALRVASRCNWGMEVTNIRRHHTTHHKMKIKLSDIIPHNETHTHSGCVNGVECNLGPKRALEKLTNTVFKNTANAKHWFTVDSSFKLRQNGDDICSLEKFCNRVRMAMPFRWKFDGRANLSFSGIISSMADLFQPQEPYTCLMIRLADNATDSSPFAGYKPCRNITPERCMRMIWHGIKKIGNLTSHFFVMSKNQLPFVSPPRNTTATFSRNLKLEKLGQLAVFVEMDICSRATSIVYTDKIKFFIGAGGGPSTLWEVLVDMGKIDKKKTVPLSKIFAKGGYMSVL